MPDQLPVPVIVGPTGIGKTRVAASIAGALGGEVIVADSRQVYRWLDIATNKPTPGERALGRHRCIDLVDPVHAFSAGEWLAEAQDAISELTALGRRPVVEGGTMMWVDALTEGFTLTGVAPDPALRREVAGTPVELLAGRVRDLDPSAAIDFANPARVVRALEILLALGPPLSAARRRRPPSWSSVRIGLTAPRADIDSRLAARSHRQVERGLVAETAGALEWGLRPETPVLTGIGYAEALAHLRGDISLGDLPARMAASNQRYARRQLAWFGRNSATRWFPAQPDPVPDILGYLKEIELD